MEVGDVNYNEFKDFTATLLLKMELKKHQIFYKYTIQGYSSMPTASFTRSFDDAPRIYYEFIDSLLVVPNQCENLDGLHLENCLRRNLT